MYYIGVDVGTGSARAGLFDLKGQLLKVSVREITINNPEPGYYEQNSENIWQSVCYTIKEVSNFVENKDEIKGLAFCATCSLVAVNSSGVPVSVNKNGEDFNIIMWMDHRAEKEAEKINQIGHKVIDRMGGSIFLEMETPKLIWLKNNLPESFSQTANYFDLADYLRWRATSNYKRSVCCITCKWTFQNRPVDEDSHWDLDYFEKIGLGDVLPKIGSTFSSPGDGDNICEKVASDLGLSPETKVGFSQIDAHCGVLGLIGCHNPGDEEIDSENRFACICGTSNCHMSLSRDLKKPIKGIWGPFYGVVLKGYYLNEAGQSAAGKLVDHIVTSHPAYNELLSLYKSQGKVLEQLEVILNGLLEPNTRICELTKDLHVWPDFHGNRSPIGDPNLKGMICGLTISQSKENLAQLYLATIQALAYGSKHIMDTLEEQGYNFTEIIICGGLVKSKIFVQTHADVLQRTVVLPDCQEPVLLGSAISACGACYPEKSVEEIMRDMAGGCKKICPNAQDKLFHDKKYRVFLKMVQDQYEYKNIMNN